MSSIVRKTPKYYNKKIEDMLEILEKNHDTKIHPYKEDYYYGDEFVQYRVLKDINFVFYQDGDNSFINIFGDNIKEYKLYGEDINTFENILKIELSLT
jgi:hypothetical protein